MNGCMAGIDLLARGELHFYKADLNSAEVIIKKALAVAAGNAQHDVYGRALYYLLRIHLSRGSYEGAAGVIGQFESLLENEEYQLRQATFDIVTSWYYALMNRQDLVAGWLGDDFEEGEFGEYVANFANLKKAWLFYNNKRYEALLGFVRGENGIDRYLYGRIELKILEALCLYQMKDKVAAFGALEAAYRLSLTNELSMPFIETGNDMRTVTAAAKRCGGGGMPGEWLDDMNRRSATYAKRLSRVVAEYRKDNGMGEDAALSPRETEVLSGICSGLSRTEVAARLGLSINTVKAIMNIVYTKLGARNTADVIRIAIEKKLIRDDI
jgi:LuxR family maltose regulon positive regulatory protein